MDIVYPRCAGLDVHKKTVVACVRVLEPGRKVRPETRRFDTMTCGLKALADWLTSKGVTQVAMESTGVYWKPVWNLLEGRFELLLVNAQHIKKVPGRKTDMKDSEWIAQLLQHGLLRGSFVPDRPHQELRELTRLRRQMIQGRSRIANRIQQVLETANIKLASVASDVLGVSGRHILEAIISGQEDTAALAQLARNRLRRKIPELQLALEGRVTAHHRFLLRFLLHEWDHASAAIARLNEQIQTSMPPAFQEALLRLTTVPGIDQRSAEEILAEIGVDMKKQFPTAGHLASWSGMSPGNNESAGKRRSGRSPKGNRWLRTALVQCGWASSHTKGTYLSSFYRRLAARRGAKRALVALGHSILGSIYYMLMNQTDYRDLGPDYFDRLNTDRLVANLVRRLEGLGQKVVIQPKEPAA
jgi:transposase